ncbi:MAG TPA: hypothetical protein VFV23_06880 [Verrucomicrobiae bacterium]|nr:hypothetical protein [Verrucomicrobiae bacterium]
MFGRTELEEIHLRKQQLAAQSDAYRNSLAEDWRKLHSSGFWLDEAFGFLRRHPVGATSLAATAGFLAFKLIRRPRVLLKGISRMVPLAFSAWKILRKLKT